MINLKSTIRDFKELADSYIEDGYNTIEIDISMKDLKSVCEYALKLEEQNAIMLNALEYIEQFAEGSIGRYATEALKELDK